MSLWEEYSLSLARVEGNKSNRIAQAWEKYQEEKTDKGSDSPLLKQEEAEENPVLLPTEDKRQQSR